MKQRLKNQIIESAWASSLFLFHQVLMAELKLCQSPLPWFVFLVLLFSVKRLLLLTFLLQQCCWLRNVCLGRLLLDILKRFIIICNIKKYGGVSYITCKFVLSIVYRCQNWKLFNLYNIILWRKRNIKFSSITAQEKITLSH